MLFNNHVYGRHGVKQVNLCIMATCGPVEPKFWVQIPVAASIKSLNVSNVKIIEDIMTLYGLVVSFEDEWTCMVSLTMGGGDVNLDSLVGKKVISSHGHEGKIIRVEDMFLIVRFPEGSKMPGQGGMVDIEEA